MSETVLTANLNALATVGAAIPLDTAPATGVRVGGESPILSLELSVKAGRWVQLHSRRDPIAEADRLLEPAFAFGDPPLLVVVGLGLGYIIDAIERRGSPTRVIALEPMAGCLRPFLSRRDWTAWITSGRLRLLCGPDYRGASEAWQDVDPMLPPPPVVLHPVLARETADAVAEARTVVERILFGARANEAARHQFAGRYLINTLRNLPDLARSRDVRELFGRFSGVPCIIASAGPSLDASSEALRGATGRAILMAVDTALRPLLAHGVEPHLVVAVDPSEGNGRHLRELAGAGRTWLVAEGSVDPCAFETFRTRTFAFTVGDHHPWPWLRRLGIDRGQLGAWGSVATSAFDLALKAGFDPIVLIGQDLAYTGGQPYCRGTTFEEDWADGVAGGDPLPGIWARAIARRPLVNVRDINDSETQSTEVLMSFRDWLAARAASAAGRTVVNATGAGILSGHRIRQATLADVLHGLPLIRSSVGLIRERGDAALPAQEGATAGAVSRGLIRGLEELLSGSGTEAEPWPAWRTFAGEPLDANVLRSTLTEALTALVASRAGNRPIPRPAVDPDAGPGGREPGDAPLWPPERVATWVAALAGTPIPDWVRRGAGPFVAPTVEDLRLAIRRVAEELSSILADGALPLTQGRDGLRFPPLETIPATRLLSWRPSLRPLVDSMERQLALVAVGRPVGSEALGGASGFWARLAIPAPVARDETEATPFSDEDLARAALVRDWLFACALVALRSSAVPSASGERARALAQAAASGIAQAWAASGPDRLLPGIRVCVSTTTPVGAQVRCPTAEVVLPVPVAALSRIATGRIARAEEPPRQPADRTRRSRADGWRPREDVLIDLTSTATGGSPTELRVRLTRSQSTSRDSGRLVAEDTDDYLATIDPVVLTDFGAPRSVCGYRLDRDSAVFAAVHQTESYRIDADGRVTPWLAWPAPIVGELPLGSTGGFVAWQNGTSTWPSLGEPALFLRVAAGATPERQRLPYRPGLGFSDGSGTCFWSTYDGGIGRWSRTGGADLPVAGVMCWSAWPAPDGTVRFDPLERRGDGTVARARFDRGWAWDPAGGGLRDVRTEPGGSTASRAVAAEGWLAETHPDGDAVIVFDDAGNRFHLTCYYPLTAAWAGRSLVVATIEGELLLFPDLIGRLTAIDDRRSRAWPGPSSP